MNIFEAIGYKLGLQFTGKRNRKIATNVIGSFLIKIVSTIITLILIPASLHYVNKESYGVWLTLASVIMYCNLFDLGLSNGLTNKLSIAFSKNDRNAAQVYLYTSYIFLLVIVIVLLIVFFMVCDFINWNRIFSTQMDGRTLNMSMKVTFVSFCMTFLLRPINALLASKQKHFITSLILLFGNFLALMSILFLGKYFNSKFVFLSIALGSSYPIVLLIFTITFYCKNLKKFTPKINKLKLPIVKDIFSLSFKFFIIEASVLAILTSNNFLISSFVDNESVTYYNIAYRLFSVLIICQAMFLLPLRPAFTDAFILKEHSWIQKTIVKINKVNYLFWLILTLIFLASNKIYQIWIGSTIQIPYEVNVLIAIFVAITLFKETYVSLINASGKLNLQAMYSIVTIIFHIPLAYFLAKVCELGLSGILLLNILWVLVAFFLWKYQYGKIIKEFSTKKIWN